MPSKKNVRAASSAHGKPTGRKSPTPAKRREGIIEELRGTTDALKKWAGTTDHQNDNLVLAYKDWKRAMRRAVQAGLQNHELVKPFLDQLRREGSRKLLEGFRTNRRRPVSLKSVKPPLTTAEAEITVAIDDYRRNNKSWGEIRRLLINRGMVKKMSPQAFAKWLDRMGLQTTLKGSQRGRQIVPCG